MDNNSRRFHELEWPDTPKKTNFTQPKEQAEDKPTEETN